MTSRLLLLLSLAATWCSEATAGLTPDEELVRMADALRSLSYEGTLVYLHANKLEALRIVHRLEGGQVHEQLVSLNGPVRTLTREKGGITCELSASHPISVQGQGVGKDVLHAWTLNPGALSNHYGVYRLGSARVAGRQTEVVGIIPRDGLRYGYRFYLDRESGLPLKSDLMGQQADPIEQVMFTSLDLLSPAGAVATDASQASRPDGSELPKPIPDSSPWRFDLLPVGFTLVMHDKGRDGTGQPVDHFVLSDGVASISVYIESNPREALKGSTRMGAVHAAGRRVSGYQVTVVGEVPLETVETVLAGIRLAPGE